MNIFYRINDKIYVNITNRCSCDCIFCIRRNGDSVGDADNLWLEHEPSIDEIKSAFNELDLQDVSEIVFCGYGEPMERAEIILEVSEYIKSMTTIPLRLNTNGLVKLNSPDFDLSRLSVLDSVSVSLNADNAFDYQKITRSVFGESAFETLLTFAEEAKVYTNVVFTVVDIDGVNIGKCKSLSEKLGIELRVRHYEGR